MLANVTAVVLELVNLAAAVEATPSSSARPASISPAVVVLILIYSGWKGGDLVFRHGIGVRDASGLDRLRSGRDRGLQILDQVEPLPREQVAVGLAAEMAVGGGRLVDRLVEAEVRADAARGQRPSLAMRPIAASISSSPTVPVPWVST